MDDDPYHPGLRARVRAGDPDAFGELFDACAKSVYNHAFRLTGNWSAAEDVMSQTFLEAWRTHGRIEPEGGSLRPWLLGIATNLARSQYRTARRHRLRLARLQTDVGDVPDFADAVSGRLDDAARITALHRAVSGLTEPELEVLALCAWSGLSYGQAAEALGVPVGTVRSRLSRARAKLLRLTEQELRRDSREPPPLDNQIGDGNGELFPSGQETRQ